MENIQLIEGPLKPELITQLVSVNAQSLNTGAYTIFCGQVRADIDNNASVNGIEYSCYKSMALKILGAQLDEIKNNFQVKDIFVLHSIGFVPAGGLSVILFISSSHRKQALDAQQALLPKIKFEVPIWKKEIYNDGSCSWS